MITINKLLEYPKDIPEKHVYLFTANHTIKSNGELVMGAGAAKAVKNRYHHSPAAFGALVKGTPQAPVHVYKEGNGLLASFQTKEHWSKPSTLELVTASTKRLYAFAELAPDWVFHMNYPAIGYGGLSFEEVNPILEILPDNVILYKV